VRGLSFAIALVAFAIATAALAEPAAVTVMSGPRLTAFDQRCAELTASDPGVQCTLVARLRAGGHPVEIHQAARDDEGEHLVDIHVAIETQSGWYVSAAPLDVHLRNDCGAGHCVSEQLDAVDARVAGSWVLVEAVVRREHSCLECEAGQGSSTEVVDHVMVCGIGASGVPSCSEPLTDLRDPHRAHRPARLRHGDLELDGEGGVDRIPIELP
jgi:hypothetical protein